MEIHATMNEISLKVIISDASLPILCELPSVCVLEIRFFLYNDI